MRTVPGPTDHVVVVGAGLSGLSAALHLLGAGRRVTVVERDARPGRPGRPGRLGGYQVDTGPTVLTMPDLADEAFAAVGDSLAGRVELIALHPAYRARFADGSSLDVHTDAEAMEAEVAPFRRTRRRQPATAAAGLAGRGCTGRRCAASSTPTSTRPSSCCTPTWPGWRRSAASDAGPPHRPLPRDARLRRVFSFQALYAGVPPARALAAYAVIAYMDTVAGVYFPGGGMHALPRPWQTPRRRAGADLRWSARSHARWNARQTG